MKEQIERIGKLEDRLIALESYVEQNKKNITGFYVGGHERDRRLRRTIKWLWAGLGVFLLIDIALTALVLSMHVISP